MSTLKKIISLLLVLALCFAVVGCNPANNNTADGDDEYVSERELAEKTEDVGAKGSHTVTATDFGSLEGYTVVYPKGNEQLRQAASKLVSYFGENKIAVKLADDSAAKKDKEILVGDTNREKSALAENKYAVSLLGDKLFFESGNFNGVIKAVSWFTAQPFSAGKVNTLTGEYEFTSQVERPD